MAKEKVLGPKEGSQKMKGVVESISIQESGDYGSISVRHGPKPKKDKEGSHIGPWPRTTHLEIPKEDIENYKIGDKVEVRVVPSPSRGAGGMVRV